MCALVQGCPYQHTFLQLLERPDWPRDCQFLAWHGIAEQLCNKALSLCFLGISHFGPALSPIAASVVGTQSQQQQACLHIS